MKRFSIGTLFIASLFLASCAQDDNERPGPGNGGIAVSLDAAAIGSEQAGTRAASDTEPLAEGSTVRVLAYTDAGMSASAYSGEGCYVMDGGALKPCTTDAEGKLLTKGGATDGLWLRGGASYHFFAVTPAVAVDATQTLPVANVKNLADFASSLTSGTGGAGITVAKGASSVGITLNTLQRRCAHLSFAFDRVWTNVTRTEIQSVKLTQMTDEPQQAAGTGDLPADAPHAKELTIGKSHFATDGTSAWLASGGAVVLPKSSGGLDLTLSVCFNGSATPTELKATGISPLIFAKGLSYTFRVKLKDGVVVLVLEIEPWTAHRSDTEAGTPPASVVIGSWSHVVWNGSTDGGPHLITVSGWKPVLWSGSVGSSAETDLPEWTNNNISGGVGGATANCYIVTSPGTYAFDATVRGNGDESVAGINYATLPDLTTATEARVIWEQGSGIGNVISAVSYNKATGEVSYTTGIDTEGNAVIGIFASNAENAPCLWSWHIWRLNGSTPGAVTGSKISATTGGEVDVVMMDRNLGAYNNTKGDNEAIGLLYQWGRKDPFPGPKGYTTTEDRTDIYGTYNVGGTTGTWYQYYAIQTVTTSASVGTEAYAVNYPTAYIVGTSANGDYDWYWGSTRNDNLWGTPWKDGGTDSYNKNQGTKSIYDPCPIGYRVPPQDTWYKQMGNGSFSNNGMILGNFHSSLWFSGAGLRDSGSGGLDIPRTGFYWSSSPHSYKKMQGGYLYFDYGGAVIPDGYTYRAGGLSVRCVSE